VARAMNVQKRIDSLHRIVAKTYTHSEQTRQIADELAERFEGDRSPDGRQVLKQARVARKLASALEKVAAAVNLES